MGPYIPLTLIKHPNWSLVDISNFLHDSGSTHRPAKKLPMILQQQTSQANMLWTLVFDLPCCISCTTPASKDFRYVYGTSCCVLSLISNGTRFWNIDKRFLCSSAMYYINWSLYFYCIFCLVLVVVLSVVKCIHVYLLHKFGY